MYCAVISPFGVDAEFSGGNVVGVVVVVVNVVLVVVLFVVVVVLAVVVVVVFLFFLDFAANHWSQLIATGRVVVLKRPGQR